MRRTTRCTRAIGALLLGALPLLTGGVASAESETMLPFAQILRRCDFSSIPYVGGDGYARATAQVRTERGDVVADVAINTAVPATAYYVRLIQMPRSSARTCNPGDPGVAGTVLNTDGAGGGAAVVRGPKMPGATGAWVFITRPGIHSQLPEEFYTTDMAAAF